MNIEPIPQLHDQLRAARPLDINLNIGVADRAGELTFYEANEIPGWSTFSPKLAASYRDRGIQLQEYPIRVRTLAEICDEHELGPIDFLKVDAEGFEREVLAGADWNRWRPRLVVVEDAWPAQWEHLLLDAGYFLVRQATLNRFYARLEDGHLAETFRAPLGPTDDFIWHRHAQVLSAMTHRFDSGEDFGLASLRVSLWLRRQAIRHPRLASACRKIMRQGQTGEKVSGPQCP